MFTKALNVESVPGTWSIVAAVLIALAAVAAGGQKARLGPVAVVEIVLPHRGALDELIREGYNISNVRGDVVTIYAAPEELDRLSEAGYHYDTIEIQEPALRHVGAYHNYASVTSDLHAYADAHPDICRLYSLGLSVQGRELWAMLITDNPDEEEDEPEFKYIGTTHGDESIGAEMCLYFIDMLVSRYAVSDPRVVDLVDNTAIWVVPVHNPDGLENNSRYNARGYDLNRSFPIYPSDYKGTIFNGEPLGDIGREPEVAHIMRWTAQNSFVLGAEFHSGALVVNYPYDDDGRGSIDSPTPDDLLFEEVSRRYSVHNPPMWNSATFPDGITNGAAWYMIQGGMEDWKYRYASCNDVIVELSNMKRPPASQLPTYWSNNQQSMLSFVETVHIGVRGIVTDQATGEPLWAQINAAGNKHAVFTDLDIGDYHRMLLPGVYDLTFNAPGYVSRTLTNIAVTDGPAVRIDVELFLDADLDGSGSINLADLALFAAHWNQSLCPWCTGDYTGDGYVDINDLRRFLPYWLANTE